MIKAITTFIMTPKRKNSHWALESISHDPVELENRWEEGGEPDTLQTLLKDTLMMTQLWYKQSPCLPIFFPLPNGQLGVPESKQAVLGCVCEICLWVQSPPVISAPTPLCHRLMPDLSQAEASSRSSYRSGRGKRFGVRIKNMHTENQLICQ